MSFINLTTQETHELNRSEPTYIGRHQYGITSRYISERHIKIELEKDGNRYFITNLTKKRVNLNDAAILRNKEFQLENGDEIELFLDGIKAGKRLKFKFILPELTEGLVRNKMVLNHQNETAPPNDDSSDYNSSEASSVYSEGENEFNSQDMMDPNELSDESSLLGERDYLL